MKSTVFKLLPNEKVVNLHYKTWLYLLSKSLEFQFLFRNWYTKVTSKSAMFLIDDELSSGVHVLIVLKKNSYATNCTYTVFSSLVLCLGKSLKELEQPLSALGVKNGCKVMLIGKRVSIALDLFSPWTIIIFVTKSAAGHGNKLEH